MPLPRPQDSSTGPLLVGHADVAAGTNLIENGDYELDIAGSRGLVGSEQLERDTSVARHGRASLKVSLPGAAGAGVAWLTRAGPRITCRPGQSSVFSVDVYVPPAAAGRQVRLALRWHGPAPGETELGVVEGPVHVLAGGWERLTVQAGPAPENVAAITPSCASVGRQAGFDLNVDLAHLEVGTGVVLGPPVPTSRGVVTSPDRTGQVLRWNAGLSQWQAGTDAPWFDISWYGADPEGRVDSTEAINAAIADASSAADRAMVYCPPGNYIITQIRMKSRVILSGHGHKTTLVQAARTTGDMIVLDADSVDKIGIRDLRLWGQKEEQRTANRGIVLDNDWGVDHFDTGDSIPILQNIFIRGCSGAGVVLNRGVREARLVSVHVSACDGPGFELDCTDSNFIACTAGGSLQGYIIRAYNSHFVACKAYGSRGNATTRGDGFIIRAIGAKFSACESQDNGGRGYVLDGCSDCSLTSVAADTNGVSVPDDESVGFLLDGARHCVVVGNAWNREGQTAAQKYGLAVSAGAHDNVVIMTSRSHGRGHVRGTVGAANSLVLNGRPMAPLVAASDLPRGAPGMDGTIIIEDGSGGNRNLVFYTAGQRFRVRGTQF